MNNYKVDKKKFIETCKLALKNIEQEEKENKERGHFIVANDFLLRQRQILSALRSAQMSFVTEIMVSEEFLTILNYCLTK